MNKYNMLLELALAMLLALLLASLLALWFFHSNVSPSETTNDRLEEDKRTLMLQLQHMMSQNADLLQNALSSKDDFYEEERNMKDRLDRLQRQKEQLEEKIMAQYKEMPSKK